MSFAAISSTITPTGSKPMSDLHTGDDITVWTPNGIQTKQVIFSSGTTDGQKEMMFLSVDSSLHDYLIVDFSQPLLMANNELKRAANIRPGEELLNAEGQPVRVTSASISKYRGGLHSVQTSGDASGTGGHLIIVCGVVCGDFQVELNFRG